MHHAVLEYVSTQFYAWKVTQPESKLKVLEFGSLDINGSVRSILQHHAEQYLGIDMQAGPGVDLICDASTYKSTTEYDVVVCVEVFEHTPHWRHIILNAHKHLRFGGIFIATMAGEGRPPHSAIDENPIREWEYYDNVGAWELKRAMRVFSQYNVSTQGTDIRAVGIK